MVGSWYGQADCGVQMMDLEVALVFSDASGDGLSGSVIYNTSRGLDSFQVDATLNGIELVITPITAEDFSLTGTYSHVNGTLSGSITPTFPCDEFVLSRTAAGICHLLSFSHCILFLFIHSEIGIARAIHSSR